MEDTQMRYQERPSKEAVRHFCERAEYFLSEYHAKCNISLRENPLVRKSIMGDIAPSGYDWIDKVVILVPGHEEFKSHISGIDENMSDNEIWGILNDIIGQIEERTGRFGQDFYDKRPR